MILDLLTGKQREPAECIIEIGGGEIEHLYPYLAEVTVDTTRRDGAQATLKFESRRDEDGSWSIQDDDAITPWAEVTIKARFGADHEEEVFRGYLRKVNSSYPSDAGSSNVTVDCQDASLVLDREHRRQTWGADAPTDDLSIIREMLTGTGIALDSASAGRSGLVLNQNATDSRFLRERAATIGHELIFREGALYFGPMRLEEAVQETILVYAGPDTNCSNFSIDEDGHLPDHVLFNAAAETGDESRERTISPDLPLLGNTPADSGHAGLNEFTWRLDREGVSNETDLEAIAQAKANENSMKIKATGEIEGSLYGHVLLAGLPVGVDGVGDRHNGTYYVDTVNHTFDGTGYRQSFQLLRNAHGDNLEAGLGSVLAGL